MRQASRFRRMGIAAISSAALAVLLMTGCTAETAPPAASDCTPAFNFPTIKKGVLSIVGPDYPPLFTYENGVLGGVDGEFYTKFAADACLTTDVTILPAAGVIEAIKNGQADVAGGGWYPTAERAKMIGQTEAAYSDPSVFVGTKPSANLEDYKGKTIGTTQGYLWVDDLQKWAGENAKLYQSPDAVFADLLNGRIDVALMAVNEAAYRLKGKESSGLSYVVVKPNEAIEAFMNPSVTNFPFTKSNQKLGDALNKELVDLRGNGALADMLTKYGIDASAAKPAA